MIEYSNRAANVYYAAQAGNWGLAAYQLNEMTEIQEVAETTRPGRAKALRAFEKSALRPLAKDIVNQDNTAFRADFDRMVTQCNGCHRANGYGFISYRLPDRPAMPAKMEVEMKFAKADLEKLLGDLVK
jgi:cytochrome c553